MKVETGELEIREQAGREPMLHGTLIQEGRAATGGRRELFAPNSIEWPTGGVAIKTVHLGPVETRAQVVRHRDGRLAITALATDGIQEAYQDGKRFLSVEFRAVDERTTRGGIREIQRAFVDSAALVERPEYDTAVAEIREQSAAVRKAEVLIWR